MKKKLAIALLLLVALALGLFFFVAPAQVEKSYNVTLNPPPYVASYGARHLHTDLFVADLHADTLLWDRDLLAHGSRGHIDLPRLEYGNVSLQFFTVVTKTPRGLNVERNDDRSDNVTFLAIAQRWPLATWNDLAARALHQAARLRDAAARSGGALVVVRTSGDLTRYLERRRASLSPGGNFRRGPHLVAALLGIEGAHALGGDLANLERLYDAGFRMIGLTHFFDNEWAGSAHGVEKGGLTEKGRELVRRMEAMRVLVDLAHASPRTIDDVLAIATRPVVVSHTGVKGTCDNARNLTDDQLRRIAATGGVVGIGFWDTAVCGQDARSISRAIRHAANVAGTDHVALGSDFDGAVATPFDASGLSLMTDALLAEGFSDDETRKIMGGNVLRLLSENLPK